MPEEQLISPQITTFTQPAKKAPAKLIIIIASVLLVLLGGGGATAYLLYFKEPAPMDVISATWKNTANAKTVELSGEVRADLSGLEQFDVASLLGENKEKQAPATQESYIALFQLSVDDNNQTKPQSQIKLQIGTQGLPAPSATNGEVPTVKTLFGTELRQKEKNLYITVTDLPITNLGFFDLSVVMNQWIKISSEEAEKESVPLKDLSQEDRDKINQILSNPKIISEITRLPREKKDNRDLYHYAITFNKEELKKTVSDILDVVVTKEDSLSEAKSSLDESFNAVAGLTSEVWIDKKTMLPYRSISTLSLQKTEKNSVSGSIKTTIAYKQFNQPVTIEEPKDAKTLEDLMKSLFPQQEEVTAIDTDGDGLTDQDEMLYGTLPDNTDTDGDGYSDGDEVKNGYNPNGEGKLVIPSMNQTQQ